MARTSDPDDTSRRVASGLRVAALRKATAMTVLDFAVELNAVARQLGLPERWTGPKVSKIETGTQNLIVEDVAVLAAYDPEQRGTFWWAFGREEPKESKSAKRKRTG